MASTGPSQPALTVVDRKTRFINSAIRRLETPFSLPDELLAQSEISPSVLDLVMQEVNRRLRRHNSSVYDVLAVRSVAEQIDALYWEAAEPELGSDDDDSDDEYSDIDMYGEGVDFAEIDATNPK